MSTTMMKSERLSKIFDPGSGRTVIVPMDHGVHDGPIAGLNDLERTFTLVKRGRPDAVVVHRGAAWRYRSLLAGLPVLVHLSASTKLGVWLKKVVVGDPLEAEDLGACGVSIHVNMGNEHEPEMLRDLGKVGRVCDMHGLPLLAMMYVRWNRFGRVVNETGVEPIKHAARVAFELGADIVKVPYTGSVESFREVVEGCPIPVVIAGGSVYQRYGSEGLLTCVRNAVTAGAAGVSAGRGIFQSEHITETLNSVRGIVHSGSIRTLRPSRHFGSSDIRPAV